MEAAKPWNEIIEGIVTPSCWSIDGQIQAVNIALPDEVNIPVQPIQKGSELSRYAGAVVRLMGRMTASGFVVETYNVIKPFRGELNE